MLGVEDVDLGRFGAEGGENAGDGGFEGGGGADRAEVGGLHAGLDVDAEEGGAAEGDLGNGCHSVLVLATL